MMTRLLLSNRLRNTGGRFVFRWLMAIVLLAAPPLAATAQSAPSNDEIQELEAFEVTGFQDAWMRSMQLERNASNLKSVLSADSVGKLPDTNIAEALNRVSSIYLREDQGEGRYVSIRGIDPILNNVTINGQTVAVSDTDGRSGRAAPLDVLSASSIETIEVIKAVTPDMDGQAIGGTINITTPTGFQRGGESFFYGSADIGYNDQIEGGDIYSLAVNTGFTFGERNEWGLFFGANYMKREYLSLLSEARNYRLLGDWEGQGDPYVSSNGVTNEFGDIYVPERVKTGSAAGGRERYGFTGSLDYRPSERTQIHLRAYYTSYTDFEYRPEVTIRMRDVNDPDSTRVTSPTTGTVMRAGVESELRFEKQERPVYQIVFGGEQALSDNWSVSGNLNFTKAEERNPILNYYETETGARNRPNQVPGGADDPSNAVMRWDISDPLNPFMEAVTGLNAAGDSNWPVVGTTPEQLDFHVLSRVRKITSKVEEETWTLDLNLEYDGLAWERPFRFKTGFKYLERDKSVDDNDTRFPWRGPLTTLARDTSAGTLGIQHSERLIPYTQGNPRNAVFMGPVQRVPAFEAFFADNPGGGFVFDEAGSFSNSVEDDFEMTEEVLAYYAMFEFQPMDGLTVIAGARYEETEADLRAFTFTALDDANEFPPGSELPFTEDFGIAQVRGNNTYENFLPSYQFVYEFNRDWVLRGSFTKTIGRPDYPDTAPISALEINQDETDPTFFSGSLEIGNPDLEPYESDNYDLSLAYYFFSGNGMISAGLFRKDIDNAIYRFFKREDSVVYEAEDMRIPLNELSTVTFSNADSGRVEGFEIEYRQAFSFLPEPFNGFGTVINASFIDSEVTIFQRPGEILPFFNQPDRVYNAQLYWANAKWEARIAYSFLDSVYGEVGSSRFFDAFIEERELVDAQVSYAFSPALKFTFQVDNLTDEPETTYIYQPQFRYQNPGNEGYGRTFRLGVNWEY